MPLNTYRCKKCNFECEEIQKFSDPPLTTCEKCGGELEKLLGTPSFRLKGGGWYSDGYRNKEDAKRIAKETKEKLIRES